MSALPSADELFLRFLDRWYRDADRERKGFRATRPDLLTLPATRGVAPAELCPLAEPVQANVREQIARMVSAARSDWKEIVAPHDVLARDGLMAIDAAWDEASVRALIESSQPDDFGNSWLVTTCELGAVLGEALRAARTTLAWVPDWPYWESSLVDRAAGVVIPPFHWAVKRLSGSGLEDGLVGKIGACLQRLAADARGAS